MNEIISSKIRTYFAPMAIYKDPNSTDSLFAGRNLPAFVKDYLLKRFINPEGKVDRGGLTSFLNKVIPQDPASVKDRLGMGEESRRDPWFQPAGICISRTDTKRNPSQGSRLRS